MQMNLSTQELLKGYDILEKVKKEQGKEKTIVIQPYGSTAQKTSFGIIDETVRSIPEKIYLKYVDYLKEEYNIIYMGYDNFHDGTTYLPKPNLNLREWAAVIAMCDYFIGCDSCGQHMAKCFDKKSSVFIAGTHEKNVSYPNDFHIIKRDNEIYPTSMRISNIHSHLSYRLNEQRLNFTDDEISKSIEEIQENIEN
jgi:ADP-heptose:LPS heptosyltransferase